MAIYEYICTAGNEPIEWWGPMGEQPAEETCDIHDSPARRKFSAAPFTPFPGSYKYEHTPRPHSFQLDMNGRTEAE